MINFLLLSSSPVSSSLWSALIVLFLSTRNNERSGRQQRVQNNNIQLRHRHTSTITHLSSQPLLTPSPSPLIYVWDNILSSSHNIKVLQEAGSIRKHSFTSIIDRECKSCVPRSAIESVILSILNEIDDDDVTNKNYSGRFVEYWYRSSSSGIQMLEAHRDIDEHLCAKIQTPIELGSSIKYGKQRCPSFGHVLYLNVDPELVLAPTLIWEEEHYQHQQKQKQSAKDQTQQENLKTTETGGGGPPRKMESVLVVPAKTNRLLRFRGDALHAVSYPHLFPIRDCVEKDKRQKNDEYYHLANKNDRQGDDENEEDGKKKKEERAVLLFNTWKDQPPTIPPLNEPISTAEQQFFIQNSKNFLQHSKKNYLSILNKNKWKLNKIHNIHNQNTTSSSSSTTTNNTTERISFRFQLLGGVSRRNCIQDELINYVLDEDEDEDHVKENVIQALSSKEDVYKIQFSS